MRGLILLLMTGFKVQNRNQVLVPALSGFDKICEWLHAVHYINWQWKRETGKYVTGQRKNVKDAEHSLLMTEE